MNLSVTWCNLILMSHWKTFYPNRNQTDDSNGFMAHNITALQFELNVKLTFKVLRNAQTSNIASGGHFLL